MKVFSQIHPARGKRRYGGGVMNECGILLGDHGGLRDKGKR